MKALFLLLFSLQAQAAVDLDGVNECITLPAGNTILQNLSSYSHSLWLQPDAAPAIALDLFSISINNGGVPSDTSRSSTFLNPNMSISSLARAPDSGAGQTKTSTVGAITAGVWNHFVTVVDITNDTVDLYINGVLNASTGVIAFTNTTTDNTTTTSNSIGSDDLCDGPQWWDGKIDDLRTYNRMLTAAEVLTIFNARGADAITNGLVGRFVFLEGAMGSAVGTAVNHQKTGDGTGVGGVLWFPSSLVFGWGNE